MKRLLSLLFTLAVILVPKMAEATYFHSFYATGNSATLNCKRTVSLTVTPRSGQTLNSVDFYLYHPATDWSDESDCQTITTISYGANRSIDGQLDWESQWYLFGFDTNHTTFSYSFDAWYNSTVARSNHLTGLGSDFTSMPGDPWTQQADDLPNDPNINLFAFHAWLRPLGNMPGGYLGALWRTHAYIQAILPSGNCQRCYQFIAAARTLGLPSGVISSNTCPGPSLVFVNGLTRVTLDFQNSAPHAMAGVWHENLGQWIPFDLGLNSAGFPWLNQAIQGISPDLQGTTDRIFTYYSGSGSSPTKSYSSSVTWPTPASYNPQNYSLLNTYTFSDTSADANVRVMAQCTGSSFSPTLPPHVGVGEDSPGPMLGLALWPNPLPAGQPLYVEMTSPTSNDAGTLSLYDIQGRLIKEEPVQLDGLANRLWSEKLPVGMYFLKLTTASGLSAQRKITVIH
jgi:hypothetical protein